MIEKLQTCPTAQAHTLDRLARADADGMIVADKT
ncbi:MAG: hypothetical protein KPEEDBHJ_01536 [Anaerolineales bacterium]|nr:hypothetical protein [Anaerolineales bacterium]